MSEEEIVQAVLCEANNSDEVADIEEEDEELDPAASPPSLCEAQQAVTVLLRYFQSNNNTAADEIDKVMDLGKLLKERAMKNLFQTKITGFFNRLTQ